MKWHVPHFEKMLYDNGQLVSLYSDAYKLTRNPLYKEIIEKTLEFVSSDLSNGNGGFFSALDADSLDEKDHLEEGAFYVWKIDELKNLLNEDFQLFSDVFNVNDFGFWEHENYVLIQNRPLDEIAETHKIPLSELQQKKQSWGKLLYAERQKRSKPRLDDKSLASWNAIMLNGFVDAHTALQNSNYLETALKTANFIIKNLWSENGNLYRNFKNGKSTINAYLEDYALVIKSFISLYEVTFDEQWLHHSKQLADYCFEHFHDSGNGFFAFTSDNDEALISRHFETEDNVIPASNSVMAGNLFRLSIYYGNPFYEETVLKMLSQIIPTIDYPSAFSNWLNVYLNFSGQNRELAIMGKDALEFANKVKGEYYPNLILAGSHKESGIPFLENRFSEGRTLFYVCENKTCQLPSDSYETVKEQLKINRL